MKKIVFLSIFLACFGWVAAAHNLHQGESLQKNIKLRFNDEAKAKGAFISWELVGDWDKFDVDFSQGHVNKNIFTIKASEYKDLDDGILLTIKGKPKTAAGDYNLAMRVYKISDDLQIPTSKLERKLNINYILPPPLPVWRRLLVPGVILLALILIILLVLHLTAKFPSGLLQVGRDEIDLKGKKEVSIKKELGVEFADDADVVFVKKRFGRFQGPRIKAMKNCALERDGVYLSDGAIILPDEEIHGLKDCSGSDIIVRFC